MSESFIKAKLQAAKKWKQQHRYPEAEKELIEALKDAPDHPTLKISLADVYYHLNRLNDANRLINEVLKTQPQNPFALYLSGLIAYKQNKFNRALKQFRSALQVKPDHSYSRKMLITILMKQKKWEEALTHIRQALETQPEDTFLLTQQARVYRAKGRYREALEILERLVREGEDNEFIRKQLLEVKALTSGKKPEEITRELSAALNLPDRKDHPELWQIQAEALRKKGDLPGAIKAYHQALRLDPDNLYLRKQLAFLYKKSGDWEKAAEYMTEIFLQDPSDVFLRNSLSSIYLKHFGTWQWVKLLKDALYKHPDQVSLYGLIKKYRSQLDSLADLKLSASEAEEQIKYLEYEPVELPMQPMAMEPLHRYFINFLLLTNRIPSFQEFIQKAREDSATAGKIRKSWKSEEIRAAYQKWVFWVHFYLLSKEFPKTDETMYRLKRNADFWPIVWILVDNEILLSSPSPGSRKKKLVVKQRSGWVLRVPPDFAWSKMIGSWSLANREDLLKLTNILKKEAKISVASSSD